MVALIYHQKKEEPQITACNINKGQTITEEMLIVKGPGGGLLPKYLNLLMLM